MNKPTDPFFEILARNDSKWPTKGDKVKFLTAEGRFYPGFTNIIENAKNKLHMGQIYTVRRCEVYSSWCCVWLEEVEDAVDDKDSLKNGFHLTMFEFPVE